MLVLITGSSKGIGQAVAKKFLECGHKVIGIDLLPASISHINYTHYIADVSKKSALPNIKDVEIIFNNAGNEEHH